MRWNPSHSPPWAVQHGSPGPRWGLTRIALLALLSCVACTSGERPPAGAGSPPHIVLIILDTLRADKLGCDGFASVTSPEIDSLAAAGVRFARVTTPCSWTRPAIGAMLTGCYPRRLGLYQERGESLPEDAFTLAEILHEQGYRTVGLTANPNVNSSYGFQQGFDRHYDSDVRFTWMPPESGSRSVEQHRLPSAEELFARALQEAAAGGARPHYLQLTVMEMHEYGREGEQALLRAPFARAFAGEPNARYLASLRQLSHDIGAFARSLAALPGWDDFLLVLTSDHGEGLDDHPDVWRARHHGRYLYETQLRVPWILHRHGRSLRPRVVGERVRLIDLVPTLLAYLGLPLPELRDGRSLLALLEGRPLAAPLPECFVSETRFRGAEKIAVSDGHWKLIENREVDPTAGGPDRGIDPVALQRVGAAENGRRTDCRSEHPELTQHLQAFLDGWEAAHPERPPQTKRRALSDREREQLRSIGYLH